MAKKILKTAANNSTDKGTDALKALDQRRAAAAAAERVAMKAAEARRLVAAWFAHFKVRNVGALESTLAKLREAEFQSGLLRCFKGTAEKKDFLRQAEEILAAMKAAVGRKKPARRKNRWA